MDKILSHLKANGAIARFHVHEEGDRLVVDVWMDGTAYRDDAVRHVRKEVEAAAMENAKPVAVTLAAVLECFDVGAAEVHHTYHQSVAKAD